MQGWILVNEMYLSLVFLAPSNAVARSMLNMTGYWCEVLLLLFVDSVLSSHFMGATIRWKSDPDIENKVNLPL